jgi:hypothetical protein
MNLSDNTILSMLKFNAETISNAAFTIEQMLGSQLADPPAGLYTVYSHLPVCLAGERLFIKNENGELTPIPSALDQNTDIYTLCNGVCELVIPRFFLRSPRKLVAPYPFHPFVGFRVIESLLYERLACKQAFPISYPYGSVEDAFYLNFSDVIEVNDDVYSTKDREYLACIHIVEELLDQLDEFVGKHVWHEHEVIVSANGIQIRRGIDYRARLWLDHQAQLELQKLINED